MRRLSPVLFACAVVATAAAQAPQTQRVTLPENHQFGGADRQVVAMSPDGTRFAYVANARLYIKAVGDAPPVEISSSNIAPAIANPVFSPDGRSIVFWAASDSTVKRIAVTGGTPVTLGPADNPLGMSWGPDDTIVFGQGPKGILRVLANGGTPETLVRVKSGESARGGQLLPGGDAVLFSVLDMRTVKDSGWERAQVVVQSLKSGQRKTLVDIGSDARYVPTGHLVYALGGRVMAVRFDPRKLETTGTPAAIADDVRFAGASGTAHVSFSDSGSLVYVPNRSGETQLGLVSLDGTRKIAGMLPNAANAPRISHDARRVTFSADGSIWVADLANLAAARRIRKAQSGDRRAVGRRATPPSFG